MSNKLALARGGPAHLFSGRRARAAALAVCALVAAMLVGPPAGSVVAEVMRQQGAVYYVSTGGDDDGPGTIERPWRTVAAAVDRLGPGDTLYLRAGVYVESGISLRRSGTAKSPITIAAYPNEQVAIDPSLPQFLQAPNAQWELVDADLQLYRSRSSVPTGAVFLAWLPTSNVQLLRYTSLARLSSPFYDARGSYIGPGVYRDRSGVVYIRLQPHPSDTRDHAGARLPGLPSELNPNRLSIAVVSIEADQVFVAERASYVRIADLTLGPAYYTIEIDAGSHHLTLDNLYVRFQNNGILARPGSSNITVQNSVLDMGFPEWIYWGDVKGGSQNQAYDGGWNAFGLIGTWVDGQIVGNTFLNVFDGIAIENGSRDTTIRENLFYQTRDDALELHVASSNIEVAYNLIRHSFEGISFLGGSGGPIGPKYIHHNVIDVSAYHRAERPGDYDDFGSVWSAGIPFGVHECSAVCGQARWKVYNNTIIARDTVYPLEPDLESIAASDLVLYNNIFYVLGKRELVAPPASAGNVFWRTEGGRTAFAEPHGLQVDPHYSLAALSADIAPADLQRGLYAPANPILGSSGQPYADQSWPGIADSGYRGAVPPALKECRGSVFVPHAPVSYLFLPALAQIGGA